MREGQGGWGKVGWGGGRRKPSQVKTQGAELHTDGPDYVTRPKGHHSGQE